MVKCNIVTFHYPAGSQNSKRSVMALLISQCRFAHKEKITYKQNEAQVPVRFKQ